ncbi:MAG: hypothetical protein WCL49_08120 [bacterium]
MSSIYPVAVRLGWEPLCILRVFKVWPRENDAIFRDLRVPGAFLVSGALRDGEVAPIDIRSEQGQPCTVENPWPTSQVQVWRDGRAAEKVTGERFDLLTRPGEQLRLAPYGVIVLNDLAKGKE